MEKLNDSAARTKCNSLIKSAAPEFSSYMIVIQAEIFERGISMDNAYITQPFLHKETYDKVRTQRNNTNKSEHLLHAVYN